MLELRPSCEHCDKDLPPSSAEALICSFECTFCAACAEDVLKNVCPNCGGGFERRPVRPQRDWNGGNFLGTYPASIKRKHRLVDPARQDALVTALRDCPPQAR